jgi:hypothetical protein
MKKLITLFLFFSALSLSAQKLEKKIVETSCGQCNFGMTGKGCELAVRIDGKSYFVDGTTIHDHGDAHAAEGFCSAVRKAEVSGEIVGDRFKATSFVLVPQKEEAKK